MLGNRRTLTTRDSRKDERSDAKSAMSSPAPKGDQVEFGRLCDRDVAVLINPQDCQGEAAHGTKSGGQRSHDNDFQREARCRRALCWNLIWRNLQRHEVIGSGGEVNWVIDSRCGKRLPAVDLAHVDLAGGEQRPEQHASSLC